MQVTFGSGRASSNDELVAVNATSASNSVHSLPSGNDWSDIAAKYTHILVQITTLGGRTVSRTVDIQTHLDAGNSVIELTSGATGSTLSLVEPSRSNFSVVRALLGSPIRIWGIR